MSNLLNQKYQYSPVVFVQRKEVLVDFCWQNVNLDCVLK